MADDVDKQGRTEQPTERRLERAREQGSVVRAHGLASGAVLASGAAALTLAGGKVVELLGSSLRGGLALETDAMRDPARLFTAADQVMMPGIEIVALVLILVAAVGFLADILVGGWVFSGQALRPDFSRLNPVQGFEPLHGI